MALAAAETGYHMAETLRVEHAGSDRFHFMFTHITSLAALHTLELHENQVKRA